MATVGILTFSDGRPFVAEQVEDLNREYQRRIAARLEADGHHVLQGERIISTNEEAVGDRKSTRLNSSHYSRSRMPSSA